MIARTTKRIFELLVLTLFGVALLAGILTWRLSQGPLHLAFMDAHIESALNELGLPFHLTAGRTSISWEGWERALDLRISGLKAQTEEGRVIARVKDTSVRFSIKGLLRGVIAPRSIDILYPGVRLVRDESGKLLFSMGESGPGAKIDLFERLVAGLRAGDDPKRPITYLRRVSILGARLTIRDRKTDTVWKARNSDFILLSEEDELQATFATELEFGESHIRLDGSASLGAASETIKLVGRVENLNTASLASRIERLAFLKPINVSLSGDLNIDLSSSGDPRSVAFDLTAPTGEIKDVKLWKKPISLENLALRGKVDIANEILTVEQFRFARGTLAAEAQATVTRNAGGGSFVGGARIGGLNSSDLGSLWPETAARAPRRWVLENIIAAKVPSGGLSVEGSFSTASDDVSIKKLNGQFQIEEASVRYLDGLPPARKGRAVARFDKDAIIIDVSKGEVDGVQLESGTVTLSGLGGNQERGVIEARVSGSLADSMKILDAPRLGYASRFDIRPESLSGDAKTRLRIELPLIDDLPIERVSIKATADLTGAGMPKVALGQNLTNGTLKVEVDTAGLEMTGQASIGQIPADIRWVERFGDGEKYARRYEVKARLDRPGWERFGYGWASPWLAGQVDVDLAVLEPPGDGGSEIVVKLGLKETFLEFPELAWKKPLGEEGVAWISLFVRPDGGIDIKNFNIGMDDLRATGRLNLAPDQTLTSLDITKFVQGRNDLQLSVRHQPAQAQSMPSYLATLGGNSIDLVPLFDREETDTDSAFVKVRAKIDIGSVWIDEKTRLNDIKGEISHNGEFWHQAKLIANDAGQQPMTIDFTGSKDWHRLKLNSENAGNTLRAFNVTETVRGGKLSVELEKKLAKRDDGWAGRVVIDRFGVAKAPVLARLLTLASLTGILDVLSGKGVSFSRLEAPIVWRDGVLSFKNARAVGSEIGITADGKYDSKNERLDIEGTIVPAYTINSILGKIPVLGTLFTGKKGSGVFAVTYRVIGKPDNPGIKVNPLSAFAPGFLRNLLGVFDSTKQQTPGVDDPNTPDSSGGQ